MPSTDEDWILPTQFMTAFNVFSPTIMVIGVTGNLMVIFVVFKTKDMLNSTNIFLANLAVADLMTLLVWGAQSMFDANSSDDFADLSEGVCYAVVVGKDALTYTSVLTILAISFERYYAVCLPLQARYVCTKKRAFRICLLTWVLAVLLSSWRFSFIFYDVVEQFNIGLCIEQSDSKLRDAYFVTSLALLFFVPFIILIVIFVMIIRHLREAVAPSVNIAAIRHRRQVVIMLATIVFCFFVCNLPYRIFSFLIGTRLFNFKWILIMHKHVRNSISFSSEFLIYLHSAVNPIVYNFMSEKFRACFKNICSDIAHGFNKWQRSWCVRRETANTVTVSMNTSTNQVRLHP